MPESNIGSGGPVDRGGGLNLPQPSEVQQNDAIKKTEFADELAQSGAAANVLQSFDTAGKHTIQKQAQAAVNEQPYVIPPHGEAEEVTELKQLQDETKLNPLFQNVVYLRIVDNGYEIQKMLSWNTLSELEFQVKAMKNELVLAKKVGEKIRKIARKERTSLITQSAVKFGLGVGGGAVAASSQKSMAYSSVVTAADGASGSAIQADFVVKKAGQEADREVLSTYLKENERILQNAAEARQKNSSEVPKMLDSVRQMINELYRTFGKLGAHG